MRVVLLVLALAAGAFPAAAQADAPPNDNFANAAVIDPGTLPFSDSVDASGAATESGEPTPCGGFGGSVWYSITPTEDGALQVDTAGSAGFTALAAYSGTSLGGLSGLGCAFWGSALNVRVSAGITYAVQVVAPERVRINVSRISPPPNDAFADATVVDPGGLPFHDTQTGLAATLEPREPAASCSAFGPPTNSWWYTFTPAVSGSFTVRAGGGGVPTLSVYTGGSLVGLSEQACRFGNDTVGTFAAAAGVTYHVQVGDYYAGNYGPVSFSLARAPDPSPTFGSSPSDPSRYDTLMFYNTSSDPGGNSIASERWDFGDGTVLSDPGQSPTHRFAADGDYTVTLIITTTDGRTASVSDTVQVRTHDVAITDFAVPESAQSGRSKAITVGVANSRYPETVRVELLKTVSGGGFTEVGVLTQSLPARANRHKTDFPFRYTFTSDDADAGRVTFQAVATIVGARDALPGDNTVIALPTKVRR